ncbi:uncharacterized protein LOC142328824 isoform X2 [Lycorma delicatula]
MKLITVICLIYLLYLGVILCLWEEFAGPYYIKVKQMGRCRRMGRDSVIYSTKLHKVNRTHHGYTANVTFENDVDGWIQMYVVTKGTNGRWNILTDVSMDACELIEKFAKRLITDIYESANEEYTCPIKKGTYYIKDYILDFGKITNIPVLPYGDYRAKKTHEIKKLNKIEGELKKLDLLLSNDVANIRNQIESASIDYLEAQ